MEVARQLAFQGLPAPVALPLSLPAASRLERFWAVAQKRLSGLVVVLLDVDRLDAAAILRCCDAFGAQEVHFVFEKSKAFDPLANRQVTKSEGSNLWVCSRVFESASECLERLRQRGFQVLRLSHDEAAQPLLAKPLERNVALWLGEAPLEPVGLGGPLTHSSLVAAALGEVARRRRGGQWQLSAEEQQAGKGGKRQVFVAIP